MLRHPDLRQNPAVDAASIYDYFVAEDHIRYSVETAHEFLEKHVRRHGIEIAGKSILDVSGGNGHFIAEFARLGAKVALTEINDRAIEHARKTNGFEVFRFDFNRDHIDQIARGPFDLLLLRAAVMFCADLEGFVCDARKLLAPGGLVIVNHCVVPTLGTLARVQLDEFSYHALRQPETIERIFCERGFQLVSREDETDPSLYVYDHDLDATWMLLHYFYEIKAALHLRTCRSFAFAARDRRRSTLIFRRVDERPSPWLGDTVR
jgi:SAM-dependent methyltransferase